MEIDARQCMPEYDIWKHSKLKKIPTCPKGIADMSWDD
jgi:hypothetical protein